MRDLETKLGPGRIEFSQEVRLKMSLTEKFIQVGYFSLISCQFDCFINVCCCDGKILFYWTFREPYLMPFYGSFFDTCLPGKDSTELDPCLGCSEKLSNVKLFRQCNAIDINLALGAETSNCAVCHCRPMWCVSCMARIFLAKQDQSRPASWLEGTCPCPTCRAVFCIMDVALLSYFDEENSDELGSEEE
ncbi:unnamed protein product [Haemonchus placei]|uniref:RING-type domain-containing protein n=1 Tax=Haemonchus placei TaxID=6290 RepID=A0A0N4WSH2_HAEPC|nr:unnamed protein product [Haemonchus placei]